MLGFASLARLSPTPRSLVTSPAAGSVVEAVAPQLDASVAGLNASRQSTAGWQTFAAASAATASLVAAAARRNAGLRRRRAAGVSRQLFGFGGDESKGPGGNIYGFTMKDVDGNDKSLKDYEGKVVLIVNLASK
mmetsp:Transcript_3882/g.9056  ORF Transcript_3882/g.9056 Transcript_3882/m.9056 type:complete len:134 (-) Transcript_3882:474-875(-)